MKLFIVPWLLALMLAGAGCKKDKDPKPVCLLNVMTHEIGSAINLYYDDQERINMIKTGSRTIKLEYKADSVIATEKEMYNFHLRKRYKLNAESLPVVMRIDINESGSQWFQFDYTYKGTELIRSVETFYGNSSTGVIEYAWNNGNVTGFKRGIFDWKFEYYEDKARMPGDGFLMLLLSMENQMTMNFLSGVVELVRNKNLLKKMINTVEGYGTQTISYEYDFDQEGKIARIRMFDSNTSRSNQFDYQYRCQ